MISNSDSSTSTKIIETSELAKLLQDDTKNLTIISCNYSTTAPATEWDKSFQSERIPTARQIKLVDFCDKSQDLPNMMPPLEQFTQTMKDLDIGKNDVIVCYGEDSVLGPARLSWALKTYGHTNVRALNGKFSKWKKEGYAVETGDETWKSRKRDRTDEDFQFVYNESMIASMEDIKGLIRDKKLGDSAYLLDARTEEIFRGETNPSNGHIPGAKNIVFSDLLDLNNDHTYKSKEELLKIVESKGVDISKPLTTSCRTGMSACVLAVGLGLAGAQNVNMYDGSFSEWSKYQENPIERGPAS